MKPYIFTNGCFDILHRGHFELFKFCKNLYPDSWVIVGINSDSSIKNLKGNSRPINKLEDRVFALNSIKYIDEVIVFNDSVYDLIKKIKPDILVKGGDYDVAENNPQNKRFIIGKDLVKETIVFSFINGYSTSSIINEIKNQ
jgi:D-beta-D-heptose 7-phosphate kinase/D-beta-D-heptose 1-phosphate adenosyltransferase